MLVANKVIKKLYACIKFDEVFERVLKFLMFLYIVSSIQVEFKPAPPSCETVTARSNLSVFKGQEWEIGFDT